jgi:hypothetical protein
MLAGKQKLAVFLDLKEIGCEIMAWIQRLQDIIHWGTLNSKGN